MFTEFDALLAIVSLAAGIVGSYVAYSLLASAIIDAIRDLIVGIQTIRTAKADNVLTDAEYIDIGKKAEAFADAVGACWILARRKG